MYNHLLIQTLQCEQKHIIYDMKAFCKLLTHQSVNFFFALNHYDAITNVIPVSC